MRRKILIFLLFIFTGFMLAGCDFFGPGSTITFPTTEAPTTEAPTTVETTTLDGTTTVAPTTVAPTTEAPTTEVPTTEAPTTTSEGTTTTTTSGGTTTTTSGTTTTTTTTSGGTTTTTSSGTTTTTTTAQTTTTTTSGTTTTTTTTSGTTTTTTSGTTTTTTTAQTTTTTLVGDEFDVTFLDWDGTVIDIVTVSPGGNATPPADPTRPASLTVVYTFTGWSGTFTNVQGDITVYATYSATPISNTDYTRADLLYAAAIIMETTNEEDLDEMLDIMMEMMDFTTEQELYDMVSMLATLKQDMMIMDSAAEMQALLAKAQDLGFDEVLLGKLATNFIAMMLEEEETYMQEDLLKYQGYIVYYNTEYIPELEAELALVEQEINDYCASAEHTTECISLFDQYKVWLNLKVEYEEMANQAFDNDEVEYWLLYDLEDAYREYLYLNEYSLDSEAIAEALLYYQDVYSWIDTEDQAAYDALMAQYLLEINEYFEFLAIRELLSETEIYAMDDYILYGYWDDMDEYHYSYQTIYYEILYAEGDLIYFTNRVTELTEEIAMFVYVTNYFNDPLTAPKIQSLVTMIYDGLYASSAVIDQEMIDFIQSIMMLMYSKDYYGINSFFDFGMGGIEEIALSMTAEDLTYMLNKLGDVLVAFESTLTTEEYTLMSDLLKEILPLVMMEPDMTQTEIDAMKLMIAGLVDYYLPTAFTTGSDLAHMLQSFTVEKTEALVSVAITIFAGARIDLEDHVIVQTASAFDTVLGDDSLDINLLANTFIDIYFMVELGPNHGTDLTAIKAAFTTNIAAMTALAADINAMNKMALTPADFAKIEELKIRTWTLMSWVENGFTDLSIDTTWVYNQDMLIDLLDNLGLDSTTVGITEIMTLLNATTEEEAYYLLRSMFNYATYFINVRDFADIQAWFANIDQFGLTEPEAIDLIFFMVENSLGDDINGISPEQQYFLEEIDYYTQRIAEETAALADLEQQILDYIASLPLDMQADVTALWEAQKFAVEEYYIYSSYLASIQDEFNYEEIYTIIDALDAMYGLDPTVPEELDDINYYQAEFDDVYMILPLEQQQQIDILVELHTNQKDAWNDKNLVMISVFENQENQAIIETLGYLHEDYESYIYTLTYLELSLVQLNGQVTDTIALIDAKNQEVLTYITTIDSAKQLAITDYWTAKKLEIQTEYLYYHYNYYFWYLLSYEDADIIYNANYEIYYTDPTDTTTIADLNAQITAVYNNLSPELQTLVDNFRSSMNDYYDAADAAYNLYDDLSMQETPNYTNELVQMDYYSWDYEMLYSDLYGYYVEIGEKEADFAEMSGEISAIVQSATDYIATLPAELQTEATAIWTAMVEASLANAELDYFTDDLYNYVSGSDIWYLWDAVTELYYLDPLNPDDLADYNYYLDLYNGIYGSYSSEIQAMLDEFETLRIESIVAYEILDDTINQLLNEEELTTIYYTFAEYEWDYDDYISYLSYMENQLDYYQYLYDNYSYDNFAFVALYDMMVNNPDMVKGLMAIVLDDAQNLFATMPADSFAEIFDLVRFMMLQHGTYKDFTPEDILALTQDLSSVLKLIGATVDETDDIAIALAMQTYLGYLADAMGMIGTEKDEFVIQMSSMIDKYLGFAGIATDQLTLILDSLTLEQINMMVKFAHDAYSHRLGEFEMVVIGSNIVNNILNIPGLDLDLLSDIYFEVYMDMNYEFNYEEADLLLIQSAFSAFMVDTEALIATVSMINLTSMDTDDIANIMELMERMQMLASYLDYPEPIFLADYEFVYNTDKFTDLVMMIFNATETEAPSVVTEIVALLGMTEEEAYYQVVGIMMVLKNLENVRSIGDIMNIYKGLRSVGLTNAEIAEYGMTIFMGMAYPNMLDSTSTTYYQDEIDLLNQDIVDLESEIAALDTDVLTQIEDVTDPVLKAYLLQVWGYTDAIFLADMESYALIAEFERNYEMDLWLYNVILRPVYITGDQVAIDEVHWEWGLYEAEIIFYQALFGFEQANMAVHQQFMDGVNMISDPYFRDLFMNTHMQIVQLYIDIADVNIDIEWYTQMLAEAQIEALMMTAIYNFLGDPVNQALVEDVLVILLDEIEAMSMDPNVKALDILMKFMQDPDLRYLDTNMMVMEMQSLSALMANMGSTIDLADTAVIGQLLNAFIVEYVDVLEITDPLQEAALLAELQGMVTLYLPQILAMPDVLSAFLASMDEAKINHIMSVMREYNWIRWYLEDADLKEAIIDAKLVMAILGDDSLDYEAVIELIYGIYYDMNDIQGIILPMDVVDMIAEMDDLMLQAEILVNIGLFGVTLDNEDDVLLFMTMLDSLFSWEMLPEPV